MRKIIIEFEANSENRTAIENDILLYTVETIAKYNGQDFNLQIMDNKPKTEIKIPQFMKSVSEESGYRKTGGV
jgi:hypothetical protein